jgi:hypothetical protein
MALGCAWGVSTISWVTGKNGEEMQVNNQKCIYGTLCTIQGQLIWASMGINSRGQIRGGGKIVLENG